MVQLYKYLKSADFSFDSLDPDDPKDGYIFTAFGEKEVLAVIFDKNKGLKSVNLDRKKITNVNGSNLQKLADSCKSEDLQFKILSIKALI